MRSGQRPAIYLRRLAVLAVLDAVKPARHRKPSRRRQLRWKLTPAGNWRRHPSRERFKRMRAAEVAEANS